MIQINDDKPCADRNVCLTSNGLAGININQCHASHTHLCDKYNKSFRSHLSHTRACSKKEKQLQKERTRQVFMQLYFWISSLRFTTRDKDAHPARPDDIILSRSLKLYCPYAYPVTVNKHKYDLWDTVEPTALRSHSAGWLTKSMQMR